jgi:hypothetical protein
MTAITGQRWPERKLRPCGTEAAGLIGSLLHIEEIVIRMRAGQLVTIETIQVGDDRLYGLVAELGGGTKASA